MSSSTIFSCFHEWTAHPLPVRALTVSHRKDKNKANPRSKTKCEAMHFDRFFLPKLPISIKSPCRRWMKTQIFLAYVYFISNDYFGWNMSNSQILSLAEANFDLGHCLKFRTNIKSDCRFVFNQWKWQWLLLNNLGLTSKTHNFEQISKMIPSQRAYIYLKTIEIHWCLFNRIIWNG